MVDLIERKEDPQRYAFTNISPNMVSNVAIDDFWQSIPVDSKP